jgi:hypothetical protein
VAAAVAEVAATEQRSSGQRHEQVGPTGGERGSAQLGNGATLAGVPGQIEVVTGNLVQGPGGDAILAVGAVDISDGGDAVVGAEYTASASTATATATATAMAANGSDMVVYAGGSVSGTAGAVLLGSALRTAATTSRSSFGSSGGSGGSSGAAEQWSAA